MSHLVSVENFMHNIIFKVCAGIALCAFFLHGFGMKMCFIATYTHTHIKYWWASNGAKQNNTFSIFLSPSLRLLTVSFLDFISFQRPNVRYFSVIFRFSIVCTLFTVPPSFFMQTSIFNVDFGYLLIVLIGFLHTRSIGRYNWRHILIMS